MKITQWLETIATKNFNIKTLFLLLFLSSSLTISAQIGIAQVASICGDLQRDEAQPNTYFKDVNNTFNKFIGTWKYTNGNEIVTFKLTKVTHKYDPEYKIFEDYLVGNYSYSTDGGTTYLVNTIIGSYSEEVDNNPMYAGCTQTNYSNDRKIIFGFKDIILNKDFCTAIFEFSPNSLTQMTVKIKNPQGTTGTFIGQPSFNPNFTLPISMIVTKQ